MILVHWRSATGDPFWNLRALPTVYPREILRIFLRRPHATWDHLPGTLILAFGQQHGLLGLPLGHACGLGGVVAGQGLLEDPTA